jgi:hypothetical protein
VQALDAATRAGLPHFKKLRSSLDAQAVRTRGATVLNMHNPPSNLDVGSIMPVPAHLFSHANLLERAIEGILGSQ